MKIINEQLLDETQAKALQSPRLRMNYNFHERLDDPINFFLAESVSCVVIHAFCSCALVGVEVFVRKIIQVGS